MSEETEPSWGPAGLFVGDAAVNPWSFDVTTGLLNSEYAVPAFEVLKALRTYESRSLAELRELLRTLREQGYLYRALELAAVIDARAEHEPGRAGALIEADLRVLEGRLDLPVPSRQGRYEAVKGRVLIVASNSRIESESSSTSRTHGIASFGPRIGLDVSVVTQMGVTESDTYDTDQLEGVSYHRIPGPRRGARAFDDWMRLFATRLAAVVRKRRPAALLASSDFVNGLAAQSVGNAYGIPVIYDFRGFWEDSWLRRQRKNRGWTEEQVPGRWGMPDFWRLRRDRELDLISGVDAVCVPDSSLRDRIAESGIDVRSMWITPDKDGSGAVWLELLESVGAVDPGATELAGVVLDGSVAVAQLTPQARRPLGRVEVFASAGSMTKIRDVGWQLGSLDPILIDLPFDWVSACQGHRSQAFHLHAWDFMVPFMQEWESHKDREALEWCLNRAVDWARTFPDDDSRGTMAWYDMAIGLRSPRLAYLLQEAVHEGIDFEVVDELARSVVRHQRALFAPEAFNGNTNHGFYTASGQLSFAHRLAPLPGMDVVRAQGEERMQIVAASQFAADGGHLEHSADYHRMLVASFQDAMDDGLLTSPDVASRIERAKEVMGWFIRPDGRLVQIGDSPARMVSADDRAMSEPHTAFIASRGSRGEPNPQEMLVLPESGYAFVRSPQPQHTTQHESVSYLTMMAGFHSRTHKHCDDLSITWFDAGQEILIDAGRFGYLDQLPVDSPLREEGFFYGRPERQYVERTRAHNTVQIDDKEHERRHRSPYGSGIVEGVRDGTRFKVVGSVNHGSWSHERTVTLQPGNHLTVRDEVQSLDGEPHDYRVWWNFPDELGQPQLDQSGVAFVLTDGRRLRITARREATLLDPVRGQAEPMRGWRSRVDYELTPVWSLGHLIERRLTHTFETVFEIE